MSTFLKGTQKKKKEIKIKPVHLFVPVLVLLAVLGGYVYLNVSQEKKAELLPTHKEAKTVVNQMTIEGDKDMQTTYLAYLKADREKDAARYMNEQLETETDPQEKVNILNQQFEMAIVAKKYDTAETVAKKVIELEMTHQNYAQLARVGIASADFKAAQAAYKQALEHAKTGTDQESIDAVNVYEQEIASLEMTFEFREKANES